MLLYTKKQEMSHAPFVKEDSFAVSKKTDMKWILKLLSFLLPKKRCCR